MRIADSDIGTHVPPFVIAEVSGNHNQSLDRALAIVEAAAQAGVQAVKLQTYTPDTMTLNLTEREFLISNPESPWKGQTLYELFEKAHTPWEWHEPILERCRELGIIAFSTPFDASAVDFLEDLHVPAYKIASPEVIDLPLIHRAASTGKPMIMSTGMATAAELDEAVRTALDSGCPHVALLKCTTDYPAEPRDCNLRTIPHMRELFGVEVGLSDHTLGVGAAVAAVAVGATIIEKHLTLNRADGGVDAAFSAEPEEMKALAREVVRAWQALGKVSYGPSGREALSVKSRRSLYFVEDLKRGDVITQHNVRSIRPGLGLPPKYLTAIVGRRAARAVRRGTPLTWDHIGGPPIETPTFNV